MNKKKGFTLAELLIVVAIIAVLVGVAIPVFTSQLEKARQATDKANLRSCYATVATKYLVDESLPTTVTEGKMTCSVTGTGDAFKVKVTSGNQSSVFAGATYDGKAFKQSDDATVIP